MSDMEVKYQACNLGYALLRNINDNFESVSFAILGKGDVQVKVALTKRTPAEDEYIYDLTAEFAARQETDCVLKPVVEVGKNIATLTHVVYRRAKPNVIL